jgi:hypothetical protein
LTTTKQGKLQTNTKTAIQEKDFNKICRWSKRSQNNIKKVQPSTNVQYETYRVWTKER